MNHLFAFGLGYSASAIGAGLLTEGWRVSGTARSELGLAEIAKHGFAPLLFTGRAAIQSALKSATHCLVSVPPRDQEDPVLGSYAQFFRESPSLRWVGYLSTIGVYGDLQGAWADEETLAEPDTARGMARLQAERAWESLCAGMGLPLDIFRLAGIYGPGRNPIDRVRSAEAQRIVKPGQVFNRIHLHDIAQTVLAAIRQQRTGPGMQLFNVTDDEPAPPQDVILYACSLTGAPPPPEIPFELAELSAMARSFYSGNRRVRNGKIKHALGVKLRFPTYREGLAALAGAAEANANHT